MNHRNQLIIITLCMVLTACSLNPGPLPKGDSNLGVEVLSDHAGELVILHITADEPGETASVSFVGKAHSGSLGIKVIESNGAILRDIGPFEDALTWNTTITLPSAGEYAVTLSWEGPVHGDASVWWPSSRTAATPVVLPQALTAGIGMILIAVACITFPLLRRWGWRYLLLGMAGWIATVIVKFVIAIVLNQPVYDFFQSILPFQFVFAPYALYIGVLTGATEVLLVWLVLRFTRFGRVSWKQALAFGIGFGAVEALLLGMVNLLSVVVGLAMPQSLPPETLQQIAILNNAVVFLAPPLERLMTIAVHAVCNVLLFDAVLRRSMVGFWLSFIWKSLLDTAAGFGQFWGIYTVERMWIIESVVVVFGIVSLFWAFHLIRRFPDGSGSTTASAHLSKR